MDTFHISLVNAAFIDWASFAPGASSSSFRLLAIIENETVRFASAAETLLRPPFFKFYVVIRLAKKHIFHVWMHCSLNDISVWIFAPPSVRTKTIQVCSFLKTGFTRHVPAVCVISAFSTWRDEYFCSSLSIHFLFKTVSRKQKWLTFSNFCFLVSLLCAAL